MRPTTELPTWFLQDDSSLTDDERVLMTYNVGKDDTEVYRELWGWLSNDGYLEFPKNQFDYDIRMIQRIDGAIRIRYVCYRPNNEVIAIYLGNWYLS